MREALAQGGAVLRPQYHAAAGGQHHVPALGRQLGQQGRLVVAKGRLAMLLEKAADAAAQALLQQVVHVDEGQARRRASCRPTVDLPLPGMPTRAQRVCMLVCS
jgi:hypothetical protein